MRTPGISARPIKPMAGDSSFAEGFFSGVRVPVTAVLGQVEDGWNVATRTLSNERAGVASLSLTTRRRLDALLSQVDVCDAVSRRVIEVRLLELLAGRTLDAALAGRP